MAGQSEIRLRQSMSKRAIWRALQDHHAAMQGLNLKKLFADDPARGEWMTDEAAGIYFDYSKNRVSEETLKLLVELAEQSGLRARIST
jgi:glucose-6-phosphate isomerase